MTNDLIAKLIAEKRTIAIAAELATHQGTLARLNDEIEDFVRREITARGAKVLRSRHVPEPKGCASSGPNKRSRYSYYDVSDTLSCDRI